MKLGTIFLAIIAMLALPIVMLAQVVDTTGIANFSFENMTADQATKATNLIYMAAVIIWGYAAKAFKFSTKVNNYVFVVIAGGIVIGGLFLAMGWAKALPLAISLLASLGIFDAILKPGANAIKSALNQPSA